MTHFAARIHAFSHGLFSPDDGSITREHYDRVKRLLSRQGLETLEDRQTLAFRIAENVLSAFDKDSATPDLSKLGQLVERIFNYEDMFFLPRFDWSKHHSTSDYWELKDALLQQQGWLEDFDETVKLIELTLYRCLSAIVEASPTLPPPDDAGDAITVPTDLIRTISDIHSVTEAAMFSVFDETLEKHNLFSKHRQSFEFNIIATSGGNPNDPHNFSKTPRYPTKSDIQDPVKLVDTYIGRTPISDLFEGSISFAIPSRARFEHHHIVAGSGHGKTQTLQYLIAKDLEAVARQERTVIILDSQGDLIRNVSNLKIFAPGQPLHDRVVIIDPTDVEWPVSLNLFDVGLERLDQYSQLDRERLTNSILELYDFVLGSLLSAEMTQKQNVIFRYVTRLMLHIPNATIHIFRELMEPKSEIQFAEHIAKLTGTARKFFETEFSSKEFEQTKKQVLRRLWGILENQTFERMFSHPRSKLDLFTEMNEGKVTPTNQPDISQYTHSVADAVIAFRHASMSITDRTIQRYCHNGKLRTLRVDPETRQPTTRDNYIFLIDPTSIPERIAQLREKQEFVSPTVVAASRDVTRPFATGHDVSEPVAPVAEELETKKPLKEETADLQQLDEKIMTLEIDKRVRDGLIGQLKDDRKELLAQLQNYVETITTQSRMIGQLETRLELSAPQAHPAIRDVGDNPSNEHTQGSV